MSRGVCHPPNMLEHFEAALGGLTGNRLGLVLDFDGTLSEFVPDLNKAVISCDVVPPLQGLARKLTLTAAMSGRAARDLEQRVGIDGLVLHWQSRRGAHFGRCAQRGRGSREF